MSHASEVLLFLLIAFVAYAAVNDSLKKYIAVLWGPTEAPLPKPASGSSSGGSSSSLNTALSIAKVAGAFVGAP